MKHQKTLDKQEPGSVTIQLKELDNNEPLQGVEVTIIIGPNSSKQRFTDDSGVAMFSNLPSGKLELSISDSNFIFDHMQFRGKSHKDTKFTLQPNESLNILVYMKTIVMQEGLDELLASEGSSGHAEPTSDTVWSFSRMVSGNDDARKSIALACLSDINSELKQLLAEPTNLKQKFSETEASLTFKGHKDHKEMAIRIQEHLGLPKWEHEHPKAPAIWELCLNVARKLHPLVVERDNLRQVVRTNIEKMEEYAQLISSQQQVAKVLDELENSRTDKALNRLSQLSGQLKTFKLIVSSTKAKIYAIGEYTNLIDSKQRIAWIKDNVRKPLEV
ncbi:MAG: carboxypeptidase-like regulatory domain-containing protein [Candidatus Woesearchaeota archaeon]